MKALKNDSASFVADIIAAVQNCYATGEPFNTELTKLYHAIGKNICEQGEKAFVVHLAEMLAEKFPASKGFSARNIRRMRDFYRTYESKPLFLNIALDLGWTQNVVILDCCETDDTRAFYLVLAKKENLSKLSLMSAIEKAAHEQPYDGVENMESDVAATVEPVYDHYPATATNTESEPKSICEPPVTACEPFLQGSGAFKSKMLNMIDKRAGRKRVRQPTCHYEIGIPRRSIRPPPNLCAV